MSVPALKNNGLNTSWYHAKLAFKFLTITFMLNLYCIIFSRFKELKDNLGDYMISFLELKDNISKLFICTES